MKKRKNWVAFKELNTKNKVLRIVNLVLLIGFFIASIVYSIIGKTRGDDRLFMSGLAIGALFLLPILLELIIGRRISNVLVLAYAVYVICAGFVGSLLSVYYIAHGFDKFVHTLFGYIAAVLGIIAISLCQDYKSLKVSTIVVFCLVFSLGVEYVWELFEFVTDRVLNQTMQGVPIEGYGYPLIIDTITDMLCNLSGAFIFMIHFLVGKLTKYSLGINYIEKELVIEKPQTKVQEKDEENNENKKEG